MVASNKADQLRKAWTSAFGIAGPECLILAALSEVDTDTGLRAATLAVRLGFHVAFVELFHAPNTALQPHSSLASFAFRLLRTGA